LLEQTAMRVGELQSLTWGDVDENGCRFRIRRESTKRKRPSFARYSRG
jgi:integrase